MFIDEIDAMLQLDFSDDFFAALRAFYNDRAQHSALTRLTFVLLGAVAPQDLIQDRTRTPFNIGTRIELTDFTLQEADKLTAGWPLCDQKRARCLDRVLHWTGGQPYLTHKVCATLATDAPQDGEEPDVEALIQTLFFGEATWSDPHLGYIRDRMVGSKADPAALLALYSDLLQGAQVLDDERSPLHASLKLTGIVKVFPDGMLRPRNTIYEHVFDGAWVHAVQHAQRPQHPVAPVDLHTWKTRVSANLLDWRVRMQQAGIDSMYAFLAAVTLWPVAEAARAGAWGALLTLGNILAATGGQSLATQLQHWHNEADAAQQLSAHLTTEPALGAALDAVLETLDVLPRARQTLPAADRRWFGTALQAELARQGNLARFAAHLTGAGALAQGDGAVAAGERGIAVSGDVQGSTFITGNIVGGNVYTGAPIPDPAAALMIYCRVLVDSSRRLSLRSLDVGASDPTSQQQAFDLTQVYVDLHTTSQIPRQDKPKGRQTTRQWQQGLESMENRPLGVLEAIAGHRQLVLLGDPGSGKSTVLAHLAFCLAAHSLEPEKQWLARLAGWSVQEADSVPVLVTLRDFARWLPPAARRAEPRTLWEFIVTRLEAQNLAFAAEALHARLEQGQAILLLDGLDEIPTAQQRTFIRDAAVAFARRYAQCRVVVTCRTLSYQDPAWQLADFQSFVLAPFTEAQINRFIVAWHAELARLGSIKRGAVAGVTRHLQQAVRRPDLWRLASNPLLLAVMALVHTHKGQLPEARALLYEETVDILLWRWEQVKASEAGDAPRLRSLLMSAGRTDVDLKRALWQLAFDAHREGGTTDTEAVADIGELQLQKTLVELHPDHSRDWAHQVMEVMQVRTGLLLERAPGVYTFPHRTFQEYLAGSHLSVQGDFARHASHLAAAGAFWREVILLAVGRLIHLVGDTDKPLALVGELCPAQAVDTDTGWQQAWLAGDVLLEIGRHRRRGSVLARDLDERVRWRLVELLWAERLRPVERAAAGATLARLGDPRFRTDAWYLPAEPLLGFRKIPAGRFLMGSDPARDADASANEQPQHEVDLQYDYYMARYPVTVAQFQAFVQASGYQPGNEDSLQGLPNHPVGWVNWQDVLAYCDWLTVRLREWPETPEPLAQVLRDAGWCVTLPSEAEWEKAARGADGRRYPWGDNPDTNCANYDETGIGKTSTVGCFPGGVSPHGVEEMSGNVWEWTRSLWGPDWQKPVFRYPYKPDDGREQLQAPDTVYRVVRGGAFWHIHQGVRCTYRHYHHLFARRVESGLGFRVVVRPCF